MIVVKEEKEKPENQNGKRTTKKRPKHDSGIHESGYLERDVLTLTVGASQAKPKRFKIT